MKSIIEAADIAAVARKFTDFFSTAEANAVSTKFVQRKSPMTGVMFLQVLVFGFMKNPWASLAYLARESARLGVKITSQGIDDRMNAYSVEFVKTMYQQAFTRFKNQQAIPIEILKQFTRLFVVDSTFKQLPEGMAEEFPGSGGKASKASLKVQLVFEFIYGNLAQLVVGAGRAADQAFTEYLSLVEPAVLVIMDLGYFRLASLQTIAERNAYFITRYHYPTTLQTADGSRIDLLTWLKSQNHTLSDTPIVLGASPKKQIACRLLAAPVPVQVAEERRRKAIRAARTHGKTLSDDFLNFLGFSVYVTNVPPTMLSPQQVLTFYRIRWQIELIFKLWKSYCGLEHTPAFRRERVLTEFYAKLLVAVLTTFTVAPLRFSTDLPSGCEISAVQVRYILADFARDIASRLFNPPALLLIFDQLFDQIACFGKKQRRRKKPNLCAMLADMRPALLLA
jgi:hypothetical protein